MEIRGLSALVTGASGFIGGRLVERLALEEGARVRAMVRNPAKAERLRKTPLEIVSSRSAWPALLAKGNRWMRPVFHCAALVRETGNRNEFLSNQCSRHRKHPQGFERQRGQAIHPLQQRGCIRDEPTRWKRRNHALPALRESLLRHKDCFGETVWAAIMRQGFRWSSFDPTNVYGPYSNPWTVRPLS